MYDRFLSVWSAIYDIWMFVGGLTMFFCIFGALIGAGATVCFGVIKSIRPADKDENGIEKDARILGICCALFIVVYTLFYVFVPPPARSTFACPRANAVPAEREK